MHSTVLVIGEDPDEQMVPFCEDLDAVIKHEAKLFSERKLADPNASSDPVYLERVDLTEDRRREWEADVAAGKNHEDTFAEYVNEYYYGELKFLPKSVYLSKPEIHVWERKYIPFGSTRNGQTPTEVTEWNWSLEYGNRFAVIGADGEIEMVVSYVISQPKWDWYVLGGRWKNFYKVKPEAATRVGYENKMAHSALEAIESSIANYFGGKREENPRDKRVGYADQLRKDELDIEGMRADARVAGGQYYDGFHAIVAGRPFYTYDEFLAMVNGDEEACRKMRDDDPVDSAIRRSDYLWMDQEEMKEMRKSREEYVEMWANRCLSPYSVLHNGEWVDKEVWESGDWRRGERGRWIKRDPGEWDKYVVNLIESLPDHALLTLYDYHY